ncbi:MAG: c-type cytochrome [Bacteroidia bacterium]
MKIANKLAGMITIGVCSTLIFIAGCNNGDIDSTGQKQAKAIADLPKNLPGAAEAPAAPKGIGEIKNVELTHPLDEGMIGRGKGIFDTKCVGCHKLNNEKLVGPGWSGVTDRRTPEWIMNMVSNTDAMLDKDPDAQKMLETCAVRMPNMGLTKDDSRDILEFMRKNDNKK